MKYDTNLGYYWPPYIRYTHARSGYYLVNPNDGMWVDAVACTNAPTNAHYTGAGTPDSADGTIVNANDCPWKCDAGYGCTAANTCEPLCTAGITKLNTSNGLSYNIYATRQTTPALNLWRNNTICYVNLTHGTATNAINIQHGNAVYHTTN